MGARFKSIYVPGSFISIDQTMVPWKGRLLFKQYVPGKVHKYGVKIYKLLATIEQIWNFMVYTSKQDSTAGLGHAHTVRFDLADDLLEY